MRIFSQVFPFFYAVLLSGVFIVPASVMAQTSQPILIEMFSSSLCSANPAVQADVRRIVEDNPNIILLNCRMDVMDKAEDKEQFARKFCVEQRSGYFQQMKLFGIKTPQIIINGRYEASNDAVMTAVKVAEVTDKTAKIELKIQNGNLEISVPELETSSNTGELYLFTYIPTQGEMVSFVDLKKLPENVTGDTYIANESTTQEHFRPVTAMEKIANWQAQPIKMSHPISKFTDPFKKIKDSELSYVAVLHDGGRYGEVLAVGELKAEDVKSAFTNNTIIGPVSEPVENAKNQTPP